MAKDRDQSKRFLPYGCSTIERSSIQIVDEFEIQKQRRAGEVDRVPPILPCTPHAPPPNSSNTAKFINEWNDRRNSSKVSKLVEECLVSQKGAWDAYKEVCQEQQKLY